MASPNVDMARDTPRRPKSPLQKILDGRSRDSVSASNRRMPAQLHENLINETPAPVLSGLERPHDRMPHGVRMQARMPVGRGITAANVATRETKAQMLPRRTDGQAFLASLRRVRHHGLHHAQMKVLCRSHRRLIPATQAPVTEHKCVAAVGATFTVVHRERNDKQIRSQHPNSPKPTTPTRTQQRQSCAPRPMAAPAPLTPAAMNVHPSRQYGSAHRHIGQHEGVVRVHACRWWQRRQKIADPRSVGAGSRLGQRSRGTLRQRGEVQTHTASRFAAATSVTASLSSIVIEHASNAASVTIRTGRSGRHG